MHNNAEKVQHEATAMSAFAGEADGFANISTVQRYKETEEMSRVRLKVSLAKFFNRKTL